MTTHPLAQTEAQLKALVLQAIAGSDLAYQTFLTAMSGCLRGYFRRRMKSRIDDVEDLVQEVLIAIHLQRHTYDTQYPVTAWAHGIARYKAIDFCRRSSQHEMLDLDDATELLVAEETEAKDAQQDVLVLLKQLPEKQREAIHLVKLEGLSITEASGQCGQSESLIKVNIHRGLKKLSEIMQGKFV